MRPFIAALSGSLVVAVAVIVVQSARSPQLQALTADEIREIVQKEEAPIQDRVEQLLRDVEALRTTPAPARVELTPPPPVDLGPITSRVDALEKMIATNSPTVEQEFAAGGLPTPKPSALRDVQRIATNRNASEKDRIAALEELRNKKTDDGQDALSHDVVVAMLDIAERSESEDSRYDVYRNLHNTNDRAVMESMLRALAQDPSAKVRKKVAGDIDTFLDDPLVESALRAAANGDTDDGVRADALKKLAQIAAKKKADSGATPARGCTCGLTCACT